MRAFVGTVAVLMVAVALGPVPLARASSDLAITGSGSTWVQGAVDQWRRTAATDLGITVNYNGTGSSAGRRDFVQNMVDFAISDVPFQSAPEDGSAPELPTTAYTYIPVAAGGTAFMYNLKVDGQRLTNLRLSDATLAKVFTGVITNWNDPAIAADNPGVAMPDRQIVPVVRSDGSGSTAQFTAWMASEQPQIWNAFCSAVGRASPCASTQQYPVSGNAKAQNGSLGVSGFVAQSYGEGAITYVEYPYALSAGFPVAELRNRSGSWVRPTPDAVAVALRGAIPKPDHTLDLTGVFRSADPTAYPISSATYLIAPTEVKPGGVFIPSAGTNLSALLGYALCGGQQSSATLGYAPLPQNLVDVAAAQLDRVPGASAGSIRCSSASGAAGIGMYATVTPRTETLSLGFRDGTAPSVDPPHSENGLSVTEGALPAILVDDTRASGGWTVTVTSTDFVQTASPSFVIDRRWLGLRPVIASATDRALVQLGPTLTAGSAVYPTVLASGPGAGSHADLTADFRLVAPPEAPAGVYRATVSITLVSN